MGYHEALRRLGRKGRIANFFGNRVFIRLTSSESSNPLLGSYDDYSANQQYDGDIEDILRRNDKLQGKLDEVGRTLDELRRNTDELKTEMNERHDKTETENMKTVATLKSEIRKMTDQIAILKGKIVNKNYDSDIEDILRRNNKLQGKLVEVGITLDELKREVANAKILNERHHKTETENMKTIAALKSEIRKMGDQIAILEGKIVNKNIEEMERLASYDKLLAWLIILTFFVGFLLSTPI